MEDPDASGPKPWVHWVLYDIPPYPVNWETEYAGQVGKILGMQRDIWAQIHPVVMEFIIMFLNFMHYQEIIYPMLEMQLKKKCWK